MNDSMRRPPALLLHHARLQPLTDGAPLRGSSLLIQGGSIEAIGGEELLSEAMRREPRPLVIDLHGATVLPGLVDIHTHPVWGSLEEGQGLDVSRARSSEELRELLEARACELSSAAWIVGYGLDLSLWQREPDGSEFEGWFPGRPISLLSADAHSLVVSPRALRLAAVTGRESFSDASRVAVDAEGNPTGYLVELAAMELVTAHYPRASLEVEAGYLLAALRRFASAGLTGVHALDFAEPSQELLQAIEADGELPLRVRCSPLIPADSERPVWEEALKQQRLGGRRWHVEGVKFMLDGTADNGSAWFDDPDALGENHTSLWRNPELYREAVTFFALHGVPTATHAIGDAAVRYALDVIDEVGPTARGPHRLEHLESLPDDLVERLCSSQALVSMQPVHGTRYTSADGSDAWSSRLGPERAAHGWRCGDLIRGGASVALGSDWPIGEADPRVALAEAQLRAPLEGANPEAIQPEQSISALQAYQAMTRAPARSVAQEASRGTLSVGSVADVTILANDPITLPAHDQATNPVVGVVVDGTYYPNPTESAPRDARLEATLLDLAATAAKDAS